MISGNQSGLLAIGRKMGHKTCDNGYHAHRHDVTIGDLVKDTARVCSGGIAAAVMGGIAIAGSGIALLYAAGLLYGHSEGDIFFRELGRVAFSIALGMNAAVFAQGTRQDYRTFKEHIREYKNRACDY